MANHAHVTTRKHMTPAKVRAILDQLNQDVFFGVLNIEDTEYTEGTIGWYITATDSYGDRSCWLNSRRHFEMRHGGGSDFLWWVDSLIQDAISNAFQGRVKDDGGSGYDKVLTSWNTPLTYREYLNKRFAHRTNWLVRFLCMKMALDGCPKSYLKASKAKKVAHN